MTDKKKNIKAKKGSAAVGKLVNSTVNIYNTNGEVMTDEEKNLLENQYLTRVMNDCTALKWLRQVHKEDDKTSTQGLQSVYTALMSHSVEGERHQLTDLLDSQKSKDSSEVLGLLGESNKKQLSALTVLNQCDKLVMTGDPGSGKSAFVDYLALCMAGQRLGDKNANINRLTDPIPDNEGESLTEKIKIEGNQKFSRSEVQQPSEKREVRQPWSHGALIPVRIILRDFSVSEFFPDKKEIADAHQILSFIESSLVSSGCSDYFIILKERMRQGSVLVMFDGLDEVPKADDRRKQILQCIEGFANSFSKCRLLVTCRPYAYQDKQWRLRGFSDTRLADFGRGQMIRFIRRWYESNCDLDGVNKKQRAEKLQSAILGRENLTELAKRPLLLSLIAYLHANRHDLPERRADLYERLLELLVEEWERVRFKADNEKSAREQHQTSLADYLHIGQDAIREVLERLAFRAHASQGAGLQGTADISAYDLTYELSKAASKVGKKINPFEISVFLCDRVGILYQRGGANEMDAVYTFPHRSFQEYLAASYFRRNANAVLDYFEEECAESDIELIDETWQYIASHLGKTDPDRWREVVVLLGGMKSLKDSDPVWLLLEELIEEGDGEYSSTHLAWGVRLASEILADSLDRSNLKRKKLRTFESIRHATAALLGAADLPARERVIMGDYLAEIGDPRLEVNEVDEMLFCFVPKGKFWMGRVEKDENTIRYLEELPAGLYDLSYDYWIGQFPVTVAQFRTFVEAEGIDYGFQAYLRQPDNTPMVTISQLEAVRFCDWLTKRWREDGSLSEYWRVTLPNEPEWEKAARGGDKVPSVPLIRSSKENAFDFSTNTSMMQINEAPLRVYACGDEVNEECANYAGNIGRVTANGIYPSGASPYGCHDMTGNVWEWTRSEQSEYPFPEVGTKAWKDQEAKELITCVLRGCAFYFDPLGVRCARRDDFWPGNRSFGVGFRVVLSPSL